MEPKFNTSFIPKKPVVETLGSTTSRSSDSKNIFSVVATVLFVLTVLVLGGLFIYKNIITNQIADADKQINDARSAFETGKIQDLLDANSRIVATKNLLEKHFAVSELLTLLQQLTVKRLRIVNLTFNAKESSPTLSLLGEVQTYNALAEQSDIFSKSEFIKSQNFSDFALLENGNVTVKFTSSLDPSLISYKKVVESLSGSQ